MKLKKEKGITLVALIITIIVLIILAAVSISAVYDSKLIGYATNGTQNYMTAGNTENEVFANTVSYVDSVLDAIFYEGTGITGGEGSEGSTEEGTGGSTGGTDEDITEKEPIEYVEELVAGDYVNYIDKNNVARLSIVLYDSTSSYGVQIITKDTVETVSIGGTSFNSARDSYNKAISTLNTKANGYLNTTYASDARSVGTKPDDPTTDTNAFSTSSLTWFQNYSGTIKGADSFHKTDFETLESIGLTGSDQDYFLGSRKTYDTTSMKSFDLKYVTSAGVLMDTAGYTSMIVVNSSGATSHEVACRS